jgi:putative membrane protein
MNIVCDVRAIKKLVGSFMGVAGVSAFISFPALAQANLNSANYKSSSQFILVQSTQRNVPAPAGSPGTISPSPGTTPAPGTTNSGTSLSALDREFMTRAAQSDLTEIQTSQLALQRSKNKAVRDYAQRMIQDHKNSSKQLTQIAKNKNVTLPKDIGPENKALVTKLTKVSDREFDGAYMQGQVQAHKKTLAEYQNYLKKGQNQELRAFASKIAPLVADHLEMAQKMVAGR